jgi:hypothetical protein
MEPAGPPRFSQNSSTYPYPKPDQSTPLPLHQIPQIHFNSIPVYSKCCFSITFSY